MNLKVLKVALKNVLLIKCTLQYDQEHALGHTLDRTNAEMYSQHIVKDIRF